ncbi:hypothetical protein DYB28_005876 [Aphanomyces astaci]|uniref:Uncharacterized protein n=1 Tax=Aphanomyces astaci TaxID=112090 RepID=A0A9X8DXD4_APHAT|nr:hypothetical protein DYB28_005876 [Aphanomyces astaci]
MSLLPSSVQPFVGTPLDDLRPLAYTLWKTDFLSQATSRDLAKFYSTTDHVPQGNRIDALNISKMYLELDQVEHYELYVVDPTLSATDRDARLAEIKAHTTAIQREVIARPDGGLYPANGFVGRAAVARTCASSRAHVGEAHTLDQALAGSTENPPGVTRAPCICAAADIAAWPRGGERPGTADRPRDRGFAMDSDGSAVLQQCFIIAKLDPPHVHSPALQALPFMQLAHGALELIKPVKTHPRKLHAFHGKQHPSEDPRAIPVEPQLSLKHFVSAEAGPLRSNKFGLYFGLRLNGGSHAARLSFFSPNVHSVGMPPIA